MKILCFDIGGTFIKYAICNENFELSDKKKVPTNAKDGGQVIIKRIIEIIERYTRESGVRNLQRQIANVIRKGIKDIIEKDKKILKTLFFVKFSDKKT